jgi:hypothetical protein
MPAYDDILKQYIPDAAVSGVMGLLHSASVQLKITRNRSSKLGDYRPPFKIKYHKISVNHDLNPYHFLLTLVHEFAHLKVWEHYKDKVAPHGKEWKAEFRNLMLPFLNEKVFPEDLLVILKRYMKNPGASTSQVDLLKHLRKYDRNNDYLTLDDLPDNAVFRIHNGFVFQKLEKMRKRYKCRRLDNKRIYLVSPLIEVTPIEQTA